MQARTQLGCMSAHVGTVSQTLHMPYLAINFTSTFLFAAGGSSAAVNALFQRGWASNDSHDDFKPTSKAPQGVDTEALIKKWISENKVFVFMKVRGGSAPYTLSPSLCHYPSALPILPLTQSSGAVAKCIMQHWATHCYVYCLSAK